LKVFSELAFGEKGGCFQKPVANQNPATNIDCPDVTPLEFQANAGNREAMRNESRLVHPDSKSTTRYCLGTRLQMRKGKKTSHKLKTCEYHDVNLANQGKLLRKRC